MKTISRKEFLRAGLAFPLALQSLNLRAATRPAPVAAPKRIMFICSCLGFYEPYFFPNQSGDFKSSRYLRDMKVKEKMTVFENLYHPGMDTSNHDSEKSLILAQNLDPNSFDFAEKESFKVIFPSSFRN